MLQGQIPPPIVVTGEELKSTRLATTFPRLLRRFFRAQRGNITIIFALTTIPVIGFVGAAVDYSRANSARTAMQSAIDATALMLSKDVATLTPAQMSTKANAYFKALFNRSEVAGVTITPVYTTAGGTQVVVTGSGTVPTSFTKVMGFKELAINVSSTVKWGSSRLRVALVLDTTGSMADAGKITALKTATKNLLTQLQTAAQQNGDVYVSIIPFSKDVNVDPVNRTASGSIGPTGMRLTEAAARAVGLAVIPAKLPAVPPAERGPGQSTAPGMVA